MSSHPLLRRHRRLFLQGLSVPVRIGIHDFELKAPQRIVFDIELFVPLDNTTPAQDHIQEVVDYDFVRECRREWREVTSTCRRPWETTS
jgi:7,8-dihydroneopterin aldolase/epimerase/oxygenase